MEECVNRVCSVGLGAIATAFIPFTPYSHAQSTNIDGSYISDVANSCSSNIGGNFTPDAWNCMAGAVSMTLISQTGKLQPTLNGAYLSSLGDYCSANMEGAFTPDVWNCMAQSVVNDMPFRQGVLNYCSYVYGFLTPAYLACTNRFATLKQDCYANAEFFARPENLGFCQPPSVAIAQQLYSRGRSRVTDVRRDRYLTNQCNSLPPIQQQKMMACRAPGQPSSQPQPFVPQPVP